MANSRSGYRPPGNQGISSRNLVHPKVRTGQRGRQMHQDGVSQFGEAIGDHVTHRGESTGYRGDPVRGSLRPAGSPGSVPLGNAIATNVGKGAPGAGRTLYGQSGTNQQYGPVAGSPRPTGRDILNNK